MSWNRDRKIEQIVTSIFSSDPRIDPGEINVKVDNGIVYLTGIVDSAAERRAAQDAITATVDVEVVSDKLILRNFVERTDDELRNSVKQTFIRDITVDALPISIDAKNGVIVLTGRVASCSQKFAAETVAWWTPGVIDVINHLEVDGIPEPPDEPDY